MMPCAHIVRVYYYSQPATPIKSTSPWDLARPRPCGATRCAPPARASFFAAAPALALCAVSARLVHPPIPCVCARALRLVHWQLPAAIHRGTLISDPISWCWYVYSAGGSRAHQDVHAPRLHASSLAGQHDTCSTLGFGSAFIKQMQRGRRH